MDRSPLSTLKLDLDSNTGVNTGIQVSFGGGHLIYHQRTSAKKQAMEAARDSALSSCKEADSQTWNNFRSSFNNYSSQFSPLLHQVKVKLWHLKKPKMLQF